MNQNSNKVESTTDKEQKSETVSAPFITDEGLPYEIPEEGSLGILAMGYAGIMLWRDKKYNSSLKSEREIKNKEK